MDQVLTFTTPWELSTPPAAPLPPPAPNIYSKYDI